LQEPQRGKTSHNKQVAGSTQGVRHRGRWLYVAARVGTGAAGRSPGRLCTIANKLKRISFTWLPDSLLTPTGKSRGTDEMAAALKCCVRQRSLVVHDCWWSTAEALTKLNYEQAPAVNHSKGFREHVDGQRSGWHSNDAGSEFARLKNFVRSRFGRLQTQGRGPDNSGTLWEWQPRTNYPDMGFLDWLQATAAGARAQ